jgi:hypothetical protein
MKMIFTLIFLTFIGHASAQVSSMDLIPELQTEIYSAEETSEDYAALQTFDETQGLDEYISEDEEVVELDPELLE